MTIVAVFKLETRQFNAVNAFVNNFINETIYCQTLDEWLNEKFYSIKKNVILLLLRQALYELKQSSTLWYIHLFQTLMKLKLKLVVEVDCLFHTDFLLLFFFVDDIMIIYNHRYFMKIDSFQQALFNRYEIRYIDFIKCILNI